MQNTLVKRRIEWTFYLCCVQCTLYTGAKVHSFLFLFRYLSTEQMTIWFKQHGKLDTNPLHKYFPNEFPFYTHTFAWIYLFCITIQRVHCHVPSYVTKNVSCGNYNTPHYSYIMIKLNSCQASTAQGSQPAIARMWCVVVFESLKWIRKWCTVRCTEKPTCAAYCYYFVRHLMGYD